MLQDARSSANYALYVLVRRITITMPSSGDLAEDLGMILSLDAVRSSVCSGSESDHLLCSELIHLPGIGKLIVKDAGVEDGRDLDSELQQLPGVVRSDSTQAMRREVHGM